jgi:AcrR family transcriptional regulator
MRTLSPDLREALLDAADDLFYSRGVVSTGVEQICTAAGVGKPVLYRHFGSKDGLILAYLGKRKQKRRADFEDALTRAGLDPHERVMAIVDWMCEWIRSNSFRGCSFLRALTESSVDLDAIGEATSRHKEWVEGLIEGELKGSVRNPHAAARHLFFLIEGAVTAATYQEPSEVADDLHQAAQDLLEAFAVTDGRSGE